MVLAEHYGVDALRYFFARSAVWPRWQFSDEAIVNRVNADLANDIGNLRAKLVNDSEELRCNLAVTARILSGG